MNIDYIHEYPKHIASLMLEGDYEQKEYGHPGSDDIDLDVKRNQNMINTRFLKLFNNITTINIDCGTQYYYYPFSLVVFIESLINMQKRHEIKIILKAKWNKKDEDIFEDEIERRSWLFYSFIDCFSDNILFTNQNSKRSEELVRVKEYFIDYEFDRGDANIYSTKIQGNKQEIKIELKREKVGDTHFYDIISFLC